MGLFDKLGGAKDAKLDPRTAVMLAAITMVGADGVAEQEELNVVLRSRLYSENAFDTAWAYYKGHDIDDMVGVVARSLSGPQKLCALANLLEVAMADGGLAGAEKKLLEIYVSALGVPESEVMKMVEVIGVKNDYSVLN